MTSFRCLRDQDDDAAAVGAAGHDPLGAVAGLGSYRPEWTWIAEDDGRLLARALWWGRPGGDRPLVLDCLWVAATVADPAVSRPGCSPPPTGPSPPFPRRTG